MNNVIFHIGMSKTGTTAIQKFLNLCDELSICNYFYKRDESVSYDTPTSGNGMELWRCIKSSKPDQAYEVLQSHFSSGFVPIISSENLCNFTSDEWRMLLEVIGACGSQSEFIVFIRDALPWSLSAYDQLIKRNGCSLPFEKWYLAITSIYQPLLDLYDVIGAAQIRAIHYEEGERNLLRKFFSALEFSDEFLERLPSKQVTNRSLSQLERQVLREINGKAGDLLSTQISDALIRRHHVPSEKESLSKSVKKDFILKYQHEVDMVNQLFFQGEPIVSVIPPDFQDSEEPEGSSAQLAIKDEGAEREEIYKTVISVMTDYLGCYRNESVIRHTTIIHTLCLNLEKYLNGGADSRIGLPVDFNPFAYAILNSDVVLAGVDPIQHFLAYGIKDGRPYKW